MLIEGIAKCAVLGQVAVQEFTTRDFRRHSREGVTGNRTIKGLVRAKQIPCKNFAFNVANIVVHPICDDDVRGRFQTL